MSPWSAPRSSAAPRWRSAGCWAPRHTARSQVRGSVAKPGVSMGQECASPALLCAVHGTLVHVVGTPCCAEPAAVHRLARPPGCCTRPCPALLPGRRGAVPVKPHHPRGHRRAPRPRRHINRPAQLGASGGGGADGGRRGQRAYRPGAAPHRGWHGGSYRGSRWAHALRQAVLRH